MAALTGQEIVSAIAKKVRQRFSTQEIAEIYKDKPVQSMKTPCIFIHSVETIHTPDFRNYAWWDQIIDIRCHPSKMRTDIHTWARSLGPMITECISYVESGSHVYKAKNATWRVEEDVLHVTATYSYRVMRTLEDVPDMKTLAYGERIKE